MKTSLFLAICYALLAVAIALLVVLAIGLYYPKSSSVSHPKTTFSLPSKLPTGPITATNPFGCGTNSSDYFSLPAHAYFAYHVTANSSGARINYWTSGAGPPLEETTVTSGNVSNGDFSIGSFDVAIEFTFQGCGLSSAVSLGFWGNYTLPSSG